MKIAVIGAGISGLSAAAYVAQAGHEVHVFEKHATPGGRARQFKTTNGYTFDMGPSWYWMPDVINNFFRDFGGAASDFYELVALDPQFEMIFADTTLKVPRAYTDLRNLFESIEPGAGAKLDRFMEAAHHKYVVGMQDFVHQPCYSWKEFMSPGIFRSAVKLDLFTSFRRYVQRYFSHPQLVALMEFPVIFLGASPKKIPALYSLMNYGGYALGTWYPMGGFYQLILAMQKIGEAEGVHFHFEHNVDQFNVDGSKVKSLTSKGKEYFFDAIIASSDYHHTETLLDVSKRNYRESYWSSRTFAPSCLIYYLGFSEKIPGLQHHTLFFEHDLDLHVDAIYKQKEWPQQPLFYACCPSKTDPGVAPAGHENVFLLLPLATGLQDAAIMRERYLQVMLRRLEKHTGCTGLADKMDYQQSYCVSDFMQDYHAYGGNAYGLANTLSQTAVLKPSIRNKKLSNLFYTGQLTIPGPGVPPSIISGKVVAKALLTSKIVANEKII